MHIFFFLPSTTRRKGLLKIPRAAFEELWSDEAKGRRERLAVKGAGRCTVVVRGGGAGHLFPRRDPSTTFISHHVRSIILLGCAHKPGQTQSRRRSRGGLEEPAASGTSRQRTRRKQVSRVLTFNLRQHSTNSSSYSFAPTTAGGWD